MTPTMLRVGMFLSATLVVAVCGCNLPASRADLERLEAQLQVQGQRSSAPESRFELHELRNGPVTTTGLLDKQTGRVWMLSAEKGSGTNVGDFEPVRIHTFPPNAAQYLGPYVPPTARALEVELPRGWTAKELTSASGVTVTPNKEGTQ